MKSLHILQNVSTVYGLYGAEKPSKDGNSGVLSVGTIEYVS